MKLGPLHRGVGNLFASAVDAKLGEARCVAAAEAAAEAEAEAEAARGQQPQQAAATATATATATAAGRACVENPDYRYALFRANPAHSFIF